MRVFRQCLTRQKQKPTVSFFNCLATLNNIVILVCISQGKE